MATHRKTRTPRKRRATARAIVKIGAKTRRRRRSSVGVTRHRTTARRHTAKRKTRRRGIGSTGTAHNLKSIAKLAFGIAVGATVTHVVLRPLEMKIIEKWPWMMKYIGAGEILIGGMIALKSKNEIVRGAGVGVLAGGVHTMIKQFEVFKQIPGIHGPDEYQTIRIPLSGGIMDKVAGLIDNGKRDVYTNQVAGFNNTNRIAGHGDIKTDYTNQVAGEWDDVWDFPRAKF